MRDRGVVVDGGDRGAFFDEPTGQLGPPKPLAPAVLAVDISASKFSAGLVTTKGDLADRSIALVDPDVGPEAHFRRLTTIVEQQMELADRHELRVAAVGIGCAGPIGPNCDTVSPAGITSWREFPLRERLGELTAVHVYGDLDGKAMAMAEGWMGAAQGLANYCVMSVSTTIGAGIVLDGELLDGATGNAGHVGHIIVEPNGRRCVCGARGCLEAEASGLAIEAITGRSPTEPTYEIMQRTGRLVGRAAATVCNLLDLDLGGRGWRRRPRVRRDVLQLGAGGAQLRRPPPVQQAGANHADPARRPRRADRSRRGGYQGLGTGPRQGGSSPQRHDREGGPARMTKIRSTDASRDRGSSRAGRRRVSVSGLRHGRHGIPDQVRRRPARLCW